jgi:hypothetical protein
MSCLGTNTTTAVIRQRARAEDADSSTTATTTAATTITTMKIKRRRTMRAVATSTSSTGRRCRSLHRHRASASLCRQLMQVLAALLLCCCFLWTPHPVEGFAAWLVDREMGCWTTLDEGEVIMNNGVVAAAESSVAGVQLQIVRSGQVVEVNAGDETTTTDTLDSITFAADGETVHIKFFAPKELQYSDVQFVIESTKGGTFTGANVGCEGTRVYGKNARAEATLMLVGKDDSASASAFADRIEIVAGWATGHEAVTLTPKLILQREGTVATADQGGESTATATDPSVIATAHADAVAPKEVVNNPTVAELIPIATTDKPQPEPPLLTTRQHIQQELEEHALDLEGDMPHEGDGDGGDHKITNKGKVLLHRQKKMAPDATRTQPQDQDQDVTREPENTKPSNSNSLHHHKHNHNHRRHPYHDENHGQPSISIFGYISKIARIPQNYHQDDFGAGFGEFSMGWSFLSAGAFLGLSIFVILHLAFRRRGASSTSTRPSSDQHEVKDM